MVSTATVGGTWNDFEDAYGPQVNGERGHWQSIIDGQLVDIRMTAAHVEDTVNGTNDRVYAVNVSPAVGYPFWSDAQQAAIAQSFLPPDSKHVRDYAHDKSVDHIYTSALLAATFKSSAFTNDPGTAQVTPGSVDWACLPAANGGILQCLIYTGSYN